ncbi:MAG: C25 family cysteine peptidase [Candidatus Eisenbacteria bacterium]
MRLRSTVLLAGALLALATAAHAATTLEREFTYDASRVKLATREGFTIVDAKGAMREFRAGRPDLPWISETIELPAGAQVTAVEVLDVRTAPLGRIRTMAAAEVPHPGLDLTERSRPDARFFASADAQPEQLVELGVQGDQRGHRLATIRVAAARWTPASGSVEQVTRVRVRLTIEDAAPTDLVRERIVREWEDGPLPTGMGLRALGSALVSVDATADGATGQAQPFRPQQVPSLLGSPVQYVIVTNDALAATFQQLADWKTQSGVPAVVRTVSFIRTQYPSAADDAERIRMFIRDAYTRWGTKWVLLGGDTDIIPVRQAYTTFYGSEYIATDMYYSCLDGNWNADGDSLYGEGYTDASDQGDYADLMPEVYVGRAPVTSVSDAQNFVNKTFRYVKNPIGGYLNRWLFFAEVLFPQDWQPGDGWSMDGAELTEDLLPITDQLPALHVTRLYQNYSDPLWRPGALLETRQAVVDSLDSGYGLALHIGHGYRNVMEVGDASLTNSDAMGLANGDKLFNLYAINCTSNAIDFPCIGEAFLLNNGSGAVTNVGSTRFDFPSAGRVYQYEYFRMFIEDSIAAVGELQARQKLPFVAYSFYDGVNRWTQMTLLMLGDPELRMYHGDFRTLDVSHPASIALSDTQFTVTVSSGGQPVPNARVTAYRSGDDYRSVLTDLNGQAVVPFRPDSIGSFTLTATAYSAKPYQASVNLTASAAPVLVEGAITVDDDNLAGTIGDGNAGLDAGETVDLKIAIRNRGGSTANGVNVSLSTTDPLVTISVPGVAYGTIAAGAQVTPATGFRLSLPWNLADQREVPFTLTIIESGGRSYHETFQLTVHAGEVYTYGHGETETTGNSNGRPEAGEVVNYTVQIRNIGTGYARGVTAKLRSYDGLATVTDSVATFGDIAPSTTATGDAVTFQASTSSAKLALVISDALGVRRTQMLDLSYPPTPTALLGTGAATSIALTWTHLTTADLYGYNIYRGTAQAGPFTKVNAAPTDRIAYYQDENLSPLTRYYYKVSAVDSSGNEGTLSAVANASTNPPRHAIFPVPTGTNTPSSVALEYIYSSSQMDIVAGSDYLYVYHADGSAPVDADGSGATLGDFTTRGSYYAAGPSVATLDPADGWSIIGASWDSAGVYVFDRQGNVRSGWPLFTDAPVWSSVACGDIDGDGKMELIFGSNGNKLYAMHEDGTEVRDGDNNPATKGVFKVLGNSFNYATPALADIDNDGLPEILYGGFDGKMYAWNADGTNVPGWPALLPTGSTSIGAGGSFTASIAVGYLDGPGDTSPEIVCAASCDSVIVLQANGGRRPGFPIWVKTSGTSKIPSPAIADINNDGFNDIVFQSTNGGLYVFSRSGPVIPGFSNLRYSILTNSASESSPIVADINGDGRNDMIVGDEYGLLSAFSGLNGTMMAGFPIQLAGEVRGAPAAADIDNDGKTEIVISGWDKNVYVWDYDFPFQPNGPAPWPQFHHDARRTGYSNAPLFLGVDDGPGASAPVRTLEFAPPSPNPVAGRARLSFAIPSDLGNATYELAIYDLSGRCVRKVDSGAARAGRFSLEWDLRDESRRAVEGGVYFARFSVGGRSVTRKLVVLQ